MKIEKMWTKQDLVRNLKKAAEWSHIDQLEKMSIYIQQELEIENLKDGIKLEYYEVRCTRENYQIVKVKSKYNSEKNEWEQLSLDVIHTIPLEDIDNITLG